MKRSAFVLLAVAAFVPAAASLLTQGSSGRRPLPGNRGTTGIPQEGTGLRLHLGEGAPDAEHPAALARPPAEPLDPAATARVLDRLPPLAGGEDDARGFALREKSLPPPRAGRTASTGFPPPAERVPPVAPESGPLEVVRAAPEGDVTLAPNLSITFSQPMVAVTSHDDLARAERPVRIEPEPPGQWRWVGAKTLLFEPGERFPMATEYRVEVASGARSGVGGVLAQARRWTFRTPPPTLGSSHPVDGPARPDALLFAAFDQKVEPQAVLGSLRVRAAGGARRVRLATAEELEADDAVRRLARQAGEGRFVAFRTEERLPPDAAVTVEIGAGTPSAEGPRRTEKPQSWSFRTYGPLRVAEHRCGWNGQCPPLTPFTIRFTNPLDAAAFRKDMVRVLPELPDLKAEVHGDTLHVRGRSKGRTTYRVTVAAELQDAFGQTLAAPATLDFTTTAARASLSAPGNGFVVLDPAAHPRFSVFSVNLAALKLRAFAVRPEDWPAFQRHAQASWRNERDAPPPPGQQVLTRQLGVQGEPDELTETTVDLSEALPARTGQLVVVIEPVHSDKDVRRQVARSWIQATEIGLSAAVDGRSLLAWASSLRDGSPLPDVELSLLPGGPLGRTTSDGLARLDLAAASGAVLVARRGGDVAMLPANPSLWASGSIWKSTPAGDSLRFHTFDDRGLYRPGESVRIKGWLRRIGGGPAGDVEPVGRELRRLKYVLQDAVGNAIDKGESALNAFGGFELELKLPPTMNLGNAALRLEAESPLTQRTHVHEFQVQEFRRPEFEVKATASEGPHFVGGRADVTVSASYFAGGALPGAAVAWNVTATPSSYRPPNRDDYSFGEWVPWWIRRPRPGPAPRTETYAATTDGAGLHRLRIDFESVDPPQPTSVRAEASVTDVNRQAWTAAADLLVHPADVYVGLRSERPFVQQKEPVRVQAIVTDLDGAAVGGRSFRVVAERIDWEQVAGEWREVAAAPEECPLTSGTDAVACTFHPKDGGVHRITATIEDAHGRRNRSRIQVWVAGGKVAPRRDVAQEAVTLVPDKREYRPGETARLLVMAPFAPAEGVLTLRRSGLLRSERFRMTEASRTLEVPIEESFTPNLHVQVDLVGAATRTRDDGAPDDKAPKRPAYASGSLDLPVPPRQRTLALTATPRDKALEPGGKTTVGVNLRDAAGKPVPGAEVALVVVDEAVLALTGYRLPDPMQTFYARREAGVSDVHLRASVLLAAVAPTELPETVDALSVSMMQVEGARAVARKAPAPARAGALPASAPPPPPIRMRTDFGALALFAGSLPTDAQGHAEVAVTLPDSLTRYRVMAVAATDGNRFGSGESSITARLPLMVRASPPRFLNFGDRFELPVVLQNQTERSMAVDVAVRARNAELTAGAGRRVRVPANDRVEVRFPMAARQPGTARVQIGAAAGSWADASELQLPVWTPATTEAFATYGQIDQGAIAQPVHAPAGAIPEFGGLEITTSSTALQALTDAVLYLTAYPFECSEQLASRLLAIAALKDVLAAFEAEGLPAPDAMLAAARRDITLLRAIQNDDGGFAFWRRGDPSWPYLGIHVAHALQRAREKGFEVPAPMLERSHAYLKNIEKHIPRDYGPDLRRTLVAYALNVRLRLGDADAARARALVREAGLEQLSFEAVGWLLPVLAKDAGAQAEVKAIRAHLLNRVTETAAAAHFAVSYRDGAHLLLASDRRADAVLLEALIAVDPRSDLIPKLVEGLLAQRKAGRWSNTQENAFVLLALDRYFDTYEKVTPDFVARAWLGERYAGEHAFRGRTTERHHVEVPMHALDGGRTGDLVIAKDGPGRLYYRIGMQYAPASLALEPADHGFTVERAYEGIDAAADVRRDADGAWRVKAGARVRVRLTLVASARRYHVALVDPLPAGLEAQNPTLATTGTLPPAPADQVDVIGAPGLGGPRVTGHWWWWRRPWFEHQNLRDERVEAFSALLWEGVYNYSYVARATTPGVFVVPPPRAEEMYHPETFGRGATARLIVE